MLTHQDIENAIVGHIGRILRENDQPVPAIGRDAHLTEELGLDSLAVASLYIALEDDFHIDLFEHRGDVIDMRTVADLTNAYASELAKTALA